MARSIKVNGWRIEPRARGLSGMLMEIYLKASSKMTSQMDMAFTLARTKQNTTACGLTISNTAKVRQSGPMAQPTLVTTNKGKNTGWEPTSGPRETHIVGNGKITRSMALAFTSGVMDAGMRGTGETISCMDRESTLGQMAGSLMASTKMIRKMEKEAFSGRMAVSTMVDGSMAGSMAKARLNRLMESRRRAFGRTGSGSAGQNPEKPWDLFQKITHNK